MPELRSVDVGVVAVLAEASALDRLAAEAEAEAEAEAKAGAKAGAGMDGARLLRTAPDELLILAAPDSREARRRLADEHVASADPDGVVLDVSDGWAALRIDGNDARTAFARLSALELPEDGWTQGDVAHVATKVVAEPGRVLILVPSYWREHVRVRIEAAIAREVSA